MHEQSKVETSSKYPLRVTGLALFNAFTNAGVVDNIDVPSVALPRLAGIAHGSSGADLKQTILGLEGYGPRLWGARSAAELSIDFFGGLTYNEYGYSTSTASIVRMRQGKISLAWENETLEAGLTNPLISPLSPTSFATVAQPALSSAGNLWTWSPQIRFEQTLFANDQRSIGLEAGLLDPPSPGATATTISGASPVEASRHPGVEGRLSYRSSLNVAGSTHQFALGLGAYSSDQLYNNNVHVHSWAATADWQIPVYRWFGLTGEAYRGRALGGLGGGIYQDVLTGVLPGTDFFQTNGVDTVGGWTQWKTRFNSSIEANVAFGIDDALASNFRRIEFPTSMNPTPPLARNIMVIGNLIFRPKTYLIFSPEYRHITTSSSTGSANTADIFTLSAGYQF